MTVVDDIVHEVIRDFKGSEVTLMATWEFTDEESGTSLVIAVIEVVGGPNDHIEHSRQVRYTGRVIENRGAGSVREGFSFIMFNSIKMKSQEAPS